MRKKRIFEIVTYFSSLALTMVFLARGITWIHLSINIVSAACVWYYFIFILKFQNNIFKNLPKIYSIFGLVLTMVFAYEKFIEISTYFHEILNRNGGLNSLISSPELSQIISNYFRPLLLLLIAFSSFSFFVVCSYILIHIVPAIQGELKKLDRYEQYFLICTGVSAAILLSMLYSKTNVFYEPSFNGIIQQFDVLFTTDTGAVVSNDCYFKLYSAENDIRQAMFGVFALPFSLIAKLCSYILFFIPYAYPLILNMIQVILLLYSIVMISRLLELQAHFKLLFMLFCVSTFPFIFFSLNMEQYIFSVFWLVLFVYVTIVSKSLNIKLYIAAVGSLITNSVVILPFLLFHSNGFKQNFIILLKSVLFFIMLAIVSGQLPALLRGPNVSMSLYSKFAGSSGFLYNMTLYSNFIKSCFISPGFEIDVASGSFPKMILSNPTFCYSGIVMICLSLLGWMLNFKNRFINISGFWIIFSFILLGLIGWGSEENGMILYTLYFSWAFISLSFVAIYKLFHKLKLPGILLMILSIIFMSAMNCYHVLQIIKFGIQYYPA